MRRSLPIVALALLAGCEPKPRSSRTVQQFDAIEPGMSMKEVTNKVGVPDRAGSHSRHSWEYDLADGSQIRIYVKEKEQSYSGYMDLAAEDVIRIIHRRGTNDFFDKKDAKEYDAN